MRTCLLFLLAGCTSTATEMLVYDHVGEGEHTLAAVPLGPVTDPGRMETDFGDAFRGGRVFFEDDELQLTPGTSTLVRHSVDDGVFVPHDDQGIVLASFFHHIDTLLDDLEDTPFATPAQEALPVDAVVWNPAGVIPELQNVENAAFAGTSTFEAFVLLPEANANVPLGAQAAVVRHEFGHALIGYVSRTFEHGRDPDTLPPGSTFAMGALNEGFADILAVLTLDSPAAIPLAERDASRLLTTENYDLPTFASGGDIYSVGVVMAAWAWEVRMRTDDPDATLEMAIEAFRRLDDEVDSGSVVGDLYERWPDLFTGVVRERYPELDGICEAYSERYLGRVGQGC